MSVNKLKPMMVIGAATFSAVLLCAAPASAMDDSSISQDNNMMSQNGMSHDDSMLSDGNSMMSNSMMSKSSMSHDDAMMSNEDSMSQGNSMMSHESGMKKEDGSW